MLKKKYVCHKLDVLKGWGITYVTPCPSTFSRSALIYQVYERARDAKSIPKFELDPSSVRTN